MSTDPGLDRRLRVGLAHAAKAVDPPVGTLLPVATSRGRRRRTIRRAAAALAVVLALAAVPLGVLGRLHRPGPADATPTAPSPASLIGTWQTPSLTAADWMATYRRAGGSDAAARAFLGPPMAGPAREHRIRPARHGRRMGVVRQRRRPRPRGRVARQVRRRRIARSVRESSGMCEAVYEVALSGAALHIRIVEDGCGGTDLLAQRTIYETADVHPTPD